jgi:NADH-quinone oxidoreductase subunit L
MNQVLHIFILLPLTGFIISLVIPRDNETALTRIAVFSVGLQLLSACLFIGWWLFEGSPIVDSKVAVLFQVKSYEFFIALGFDRITAVYLVVGAVLAFLVTVYSRDYLHREPGYKRFFNTILFFYFGYNLVILSGNLETLFIGWEILGLSSFLLIAFYRDRYIPVKNAVKVFSIYRVGDVGIILAMWLSHHMWNENIVFIKLSNYDLVNSQLQTHSWTGVFISLMLLIAAAAKSAQLPFSSWLARAMEGPTPSSAIFYGSLSVHLGVFILLKTFPFWEHQTSVRILIGVLGLSTSIIATGIAHVQASVKSQIAYASVAQIGLMFIEVAAGLETVVLIHFAGNAFLRTYQLLVSPSVVSYLIREQFYNFVPRIHTVEDSLPNKLRNTFFILCLKEWNLDTFLYLYLWYPMKWLGRKMDFLTVKWVLFIFIPLYLIGLFSVYNKDLTPDTIEKALPFIFCLIALVMVLKSFVKRKNVYLGWTLVVMSHFWIALAVSFNEQFTFAHVHLYLSGIAACGILGFLCLYRIYVAETLVDLDQFYGYSYLYPKISFLFLLACIGVAGFPITPSFIGEDLIFSHIHEDQAVLALFVALTFIINGLSVIRIYARVFLGPYAKSMYETANRSS